MKKQDNKEKVRANQVIEKGKKNTVYRLALCGMLLGFAILLGYVEFLIPFSFGIPGAKLGLSNLAVVLCLYILGTKEALSVAVGRILISSFLFGNSFSLLYSLAGGMVSFSIMLLIKKCKSIGIIGTSMMGGVSHNLAQLLIAFFIVRQSVIFYYVPFLVFFGALTGVLNGLLAKLVRERISKTGWIGE